MKSIEEINAQFINTIQEDPLDYESIVNQLELMGNSLGMIDGFHWGSSTNASLEFKTISEKYINPVLERAKSSQDFWTILIHKCDSFDREFLKAICLYIPEDREFRKEIFYSSMKKFTLKSYYSFSYLFSTLKLTLEELYNEEEILGLIPQYMAIIPFISSVHHKIDFYEKILLKEPTALISLMRLNPLITPDFIERNLKIHPKALSFIPFNIKINIPPEESHLYVDAIKGAPRSIFSILNPSIDLVKAAINTSSFLFNQIRNAFPDLDIDEGFTKEDKLELIRISPGTIFYFKNQDEDMQIESLIASHKIDVNHPSAKTLTASFLLLKEPSNRVISIALLLGLETKIINLYYPHYNLSNLEMLPFEMDIATKYNI